MNTRGTVAFAATALMLWKAAELLTRGYIPGPLSVATAFTDPVFLHRLLAAYTATASRALLGYTLGLAAGLSLGLAAAAVRLELLEPAATLVASVPPIAWIPILIALLGADDIRLPVLAAFMGAFPPILYEVVHTVSSLDPEEVGVALTLGAHGLYLWRTIILPRVSERVFPAAKIGAIMAWKIVFASEMIAVPSGLGYLAMLYADLLDLRHLIAVVAVLTITVVSMVHLISIVERRIISSRGLGVESEWLR